MYDTETESSSDHNDGSEGSYVCTVAAAKKYSLFKMSNTVAASSLNL